MTRQERRTWRQRQYLLERAMRRASPDYQAGGESGALKVLGSEDCLPGWLRPLDYRVSGEIGALRVPSKSLTWHLAKPPNGATPPLGRGSDRSGAAYVVGVHEVRFPKPIIHHRWRRLMEDN